MFMFSISVGLFLYVTMASIAIAPPNVDATASSAAGAGSVTKRQYGPMYSNNNNRWPPNRGRQQVSDRQAVDAIRHRSICIANCANDLFTAKNAIGDARYLAKFTMTDQLAWQMKAEELADGQKKPQRERRRERRWRERSRSSTAWDDSLVREEIRYYEAKYREHQAFVRNMLHFDSEDSVGRHNEKVATGAQTMILGLQLTVDAWKCVRHCARGGGVGIGNWRSNRHRWVGKQEDQHQPKEAAKPVTGADTHSTVFKRRKNTTKKSGNPVASHHEAMDIVA